MRMRVLAAGLAVALAGCGAGGGAPVDAKVVYGGRAYSPETDGDLTLNLTGDGGNSGSGKVEADGSVKIVSSQGGGLRAGKYKVAVNKYPTKAEMAKLKTSPTPVVKDTGEVWDVGGGGPFVLDMGKVK